MIVTILAVVVGWHIGTWCGGIIIDWLGYQLSGKLK